MLDNDHRSKITVEDLLHLKRAERPATEFWSRFESELRQRQLAALLEKRPWWQTSVLMMRRAMVPVGAALAVGTVAFVTTHDFSSSANPLSVAVARPLVSAPRISGTEHPAVVAKEAVDSDSMPVVQRAVATLSDQLPAGAAQLTPWSAPIPADTPSSRSIAASLARLEATEPDLANAGMGAALPVANSRLDSDSTPASVELASVSSVVSKRSHLLAQIDDRRFTPEPQAPQLVRERLARRLADTDFNDSFSRVELDRGGVSLKF
jgi:hypothetical protein